jgi:hypothetical protein
MYLYLALVAATVGLVLLTTVAAAFAPVPVCAPALAPLKPDLCFHLQLQKKTEGLPFPQKLIRKLGAGATGAHCAKSDLDNPRLYVVYLTVSMKLRKKLDEGVILPGFGIRYENLAGVKSWEIAQEEGMWSEELPEDSDEFSSDDSESESDSDYDFEPELPAQIAKKAGNDQGGPSSAKQTNPPAAASRQTAIDLYFNPKASQPKASQPKASQLKGSSKDPIELSDSE